MKRLALLLLSFLLFILLFAGIFYFFFARFTDEPEYAELSDEE